MSTDNLTAMRRSLIWFLLALAWGVDCVLALSRHNWQQGGLTAFFALCFLLIGLLFRKREQRNPRVRR